MSILEALAGRLEAECRSTYEAILREGPDARGMAVALLARRDWAELVDASQLQACTALVTDVVDATAVCLPDQDLLFSRPPLQVRLSVQGNLPTVIVAHFKSKREGEAETAPRRIEQAAVVGQRVRELLTENANAAIVVLGDFNDTPASASGRTFIDESGLVALSGHGGWKSRYSYNFGGISQLLDWILVSPALLPTLTETGIVHANADYAWSMASKFSPDGLPLRFSDHDVPYADFTWPLLPPQPMPTAVSKAATPLPSPTAIPTVLNTVAPMPDATVTPDQELAASEPSVPAPTTSANVTQAQPAAQAGYLLLAAAALAIALVGFLLARLRRGR